MINKVERKKGYGSFFSYIDHKSIIFSNSKNSFLPQNRKLFYSGRHAIKYIIETIKLENTINTFWIPEYYSQHVTSWLKVNYSNIKIYKVNPLEKSHTIKAYEFLNNNDIILINNFWGLSNCSVDIKNRKVQIIEDHSHGWLSNSCKTSKADFCFASLRKSLPTPLGGIAWKPNKNQLETIEYSNSALYNKLWDDILLGMKKKHEFEKSVQNEEVFKDEFLKIVNDAENNMHNNYDITRLSLNHEKLIETYLKIDYLSFKDENYFLIKSLLKDNTIFKILQSKSSGFGLILHFKDLNYFISFKDYLISKNIYPSLLWPENNPKYGYFINIHIDYRYNLNDIEFIANIINNFSLN